MDTPKTDRFWTGTIETIAHAEKVKRYGAVAFFILGALMSISGLFPVDPSKLFAGAIFWIPSLILYRNPSKIAVCILAAVTGLTVVMTAVFTVYSLANSNGLQWLGLALTVIWIVPLIATIRMARAVFFLLKQNSETEASVSA